MVFLVLKILLTLTITKIALICLSFPCIVVTLFLGIRLDDAGLNNSALYAMIAYCVGVAVVIVFDIYLSLKKDTKASFTVGGAEKDGEFTIIPLNRVLHKFASSEANS